MRSILLLLTLLQLNNIRLNSLLSRGIRSKNVCYSQTASIRHAHHSFPVLSTGFKLSASRARASGDKTALSRIKSYLNNFRIPQSVTLELPIMFFYCTLYNDYRATIAFRSFMFILRFFFFVGSCVHYRSFSRLS